MQELHVVVLIFMAESFIYHPMDLSSGATATAADILNGKTAVINGEIVTGTMTNRGNVSATLNAGGSYTIPVGYHAGGGTVRVNSLASQTAGTATAADIISGKTAWVNGVLLTGNAAPGSQVATGTAYIDSSNFSFSCGFRPSQFVVFMYSTDSEYQWGGMLFISMYYNGNTSYELASSVYF